MEAITTEKTYAQSQEDLGICNFIGQLVKSDLPKSYQFLDVGANDGKTFSNTHLLTELYPEYSGYFVEPHPEAFKRLKELYKPKSGKKGKHKFFNFAIGAAPGKLPLHINGSHLKNGDVGLLSTLSEADKLRWKDTEQWETIEVEVKTYPFAKDKFDLISIDAEGMDEVILEQIDLTYTYLLIIEWNSNEDVGSRIGEYCSKFKLNRVMQTAENLIFMRTN